MREIPSVQERLYTTLLYFKNKKQKSLHLVPNSCLTPYFYTLKFMVAECPKYCKGQAAKM